MKIIKLLSIFLMGLSFAACSNDNSLNSISGLTVGFSQPTMDISEKSNVVNVPLTLSGENNGPVKVNVVLKETSGTLVENDKTVILTSTNLVIPEGVNMVDAEVLCKIETQSDDFDRFFILEITSAEGAEVSTSICKININEVVDPFYKLIGKYTFSGVSIAGENPVNMSFDVELIEDKPGKSYMVKGFTGYLAETSFVGENGEYWTLEYNESDKSLTLVKGDYFAKAVPFGGGLGPCDCCVMPVEISGNNVIEKNAWNATWNDSFTTITFEENTIFAGGICKNGEFVAFYDLITNVVLTKK